jgi:translation initiation factor IF-2
MAQDREEGKKNKEKLSGPASKGRVTGKAGSVAPPKKSGKESVNNKKGKSEPAASPKAAGREKAKSPVEASKGSRSTQTTAPKAGTKPSKSGTMQAGKGKTSTAKPGSKPGSAGKATGRVARPATKGKVASQPAIKSGATSKPSAKRPVAKPNLVKATIGPDTAPIAVPKKEAVAARPKVVELPAALTVRQLANLLGISPIDVIKELMNNGIMANINQQVDYETAAIVAGEMDFETKEEAPPVKEAEAKLPQPLRHRFYEGEDPKNLQPRPSVVTVLGHVDHGKTKLLDAIRHTKVAEGEVGGITQHIGAYQIETDDKKITFLDTPGHEAFTAMRARGAQVTDLAVLVVAADDGVMPQTKEAIDHARAAQVPIIVALNKMDKPNANPEVVKQQLADVGLTLEEWGGDTICVPISAKLNQGIEELLENILLVAELEELKANPNRPAVGTVIEGKLDKSRGATATLLVQNGTLKVGDVIVIDELSGRVRAMFNDKGKPVTEAGPSTPVAILGLPDVPRAGDTFKVVANERTARAMAAKYAEKKQRADKQPTKVLSLDDLYNQIQAGKVKELNLILKADVQGSLEPIENSLDKLGDENLKVKIIHDGTGNVTESDIMLAVASRAIVIGFNVEVDPAARRMADAEGVDIRLYDIIYKLVDDIEKALTGLLEPVYADVVIGRAEVRAIFRIPQRGKIAGVYVTEGQVARNALARISRNGEVIYDSQVSSLKRFTEDVKEVNTGFECGVGLENFNEFIEGDTIEFYRRERVS